LRVVTSLVAWLGVGIRACWREAEAEGARPWPSPEGEGDRRHARARRPAGVSSVAGFVAGPQKGLGRAEL
jgi:hypothetical protein